MNEEMNRSLRLPFFHARREGDKVVTRGESKRFLGHAIGGAGDARDGIFAEWSWDGSRLSVRNDRYGFYPLYYFAKDDEICVSPSIIRLLMEGASPEIDFTALSVFLRVGFFIGEDTPFLSIRALPPDTKFVWKDGLLSVSGRYAFAKPQNPTRASAVDEYISRFRDAILRRLPPDDNFAVPLSGGRDSRHIFLQLAELGHRPKLCVTVKKFPPCSGEDVRIATRLARAARTEHIVIDQKVSRFRAERRKNIVTNFCADEHSWFLAVADYLRGKFRTIYDGIGGDVLSEVDYVTRERVDLYESGNFEAFARSIPEYDGESVKKLIRPEHRSLIEDDVALQHLTEEMKKHANTANPVTSFIFWNRTRREIALSPFSVFRDISNVYCPYLDHDLYDFLSSLPPGIQLDKPFHTEVVLRAFPRYAHIPFEEKSAYAPESRFHYILFRKDLASFLISKRPSLLLRGTPLMPGLLGPLFKRRLSPLALFLIQLEQLRESPGYF